MCRLRTNFARLGDPLQGLHKRKQANLASLVGNAPLSPPAAILLLKGSMSLDFRVASLPYSTAITDSLDSQVATAPLRIQFAGVTPVPLPPRRGRFALLSAFGLIRCEQHFSELAASGGSPPIRLRRTSPRESVSLGSQVVSLPYEPSSLATPIQRAE